MNEGQSIIVLGMHRSGTSAMAGVLNRVGVSLGNNLLPAQAGVNEKGFWENGRVVELNDDLLLALGSCWDDWLPLPELWWQSEPVERFIHRAKAILRADFSGAALWGVKDPRICRLLPFWQRVNAELEVGTGYVLLIRHPWQVAQSLMKRDGFSLDKSLLIWLAHVLAAERYTRESPRAIVFFDQLMQDPLDIIQRIDRGLGLSLATSFSSVEGDISRFVSPGLRHHSENTFPEQSALVEQATAAFRAMSELAHSDAPEVINAELDNIEKQVSILAQGSATVLLEQLRDASRERGHYQLIWRELSRLWFWKYLAPVRLLEKRLRRQR